MKFFTLYILLGAYKYLLKLLMKRLHVEEKKELPARLASFNYSGMVSRITGDLYRSFVGQDYRIGTLPTWTIPDTFFESSMVGFVQGMSQLLSTQFTCLTVFF